MATEVRTEVDKWLELVSAYENEFKKWEARTAKIIKRYRDDNRSASGNETAKFNILWANVQTLTPAVYARMPKADVSRRFGDNDPVGRVGSLLIERSLDYEIEHYPDFRSAMRHCVEDRFLGGRGVAWARYEPHVIAQDVPADGLQITEDIDPGEGEPEEAPPEQIDYECSPTDYVHWKDFGHSPARTWEEVTAVWRWVYMTKQAVTDRFGAELAEDIPFDSSPDALNRYTQKDNVKDKAKICELWDKESNCVYWFCKGMPQLIDERPDPLELEGFFPCARPLYATTTSDNLIPVPDFVLYQDQANELDILSDRIDGLVKALRVRGIYDASQPALQRLLTEGDNNTLVGTDKWAQFSEKQGLKGSIDLLPIEIFANTLLTCYQARADIQGQIYQITGISDIIRGETKASETLGAQEIKGKYAGLRLRSMQEAVAMFASELLRLKAQIICTKYQPQTILAYAAADQMSEADQALIPQALELIANDPLRNFRIEVAADSLVQIDEQQNKQDAMEFLNAFSNFMREAVPAGQASPEMVPVLMDMIKFGVRNFKAARTMEGTIDVALEQLKKKAAEAAANPPPNPEMQKAQAKAQADAQAQQMQMQADAQMEQQRLQAEQQMEAFRIQTETQAENQRVQFQSALDQQAAAFEQKFLAWKTIQDNDTKIEVAEIAADSRAQAVRERPETQPQ